MLPILFGCSQNKSKKLEEIKLEIQELRDLESKKIYLEGILIELQDLQLEEESFRLHIEEGDKSRKEFEDRKREIEEEHYLKISEYFDNYGYPSRAELGQYAAYVPFVVLYYAERDDYYKEDQFKYFFGAYSFNDLPQNMFYTYLYKYYEVIKAEEYEEIEELTVEENIHRMMDELGLEY